MHRFTFLITILLISLLALTACPGGEDPTPAPPVVEPAPETPEVVEPPEVETPEVIETPEVETPEPMEEETPAVETPEPMEEETPAAETPEPMEEETPVAETPEPTEEEATLDIAESDEFGQFLVDQEGMSLYLFTQDEENMSTCVDQCAENWPPFTVESPDEITVGEELDEGLIDTFEREDDGSLQVSYNGHPLYYYIGDEEPGDTNGQGVGEVWYLVNPEGEMIEEMAAETE
jgi:predicted lipoprotein with Yx(FWY)xxD motif